MSELQWYSNQKEIGLSSHHKHFLWAVHFMCKMSQNCRRVLSCNSQTELSCPGITIKPGDGCPYQNSELSSLTVISTSAQTEPF